ncbi:MAG: EF-hand domain-containing protein [Sphingomonas sp.]|uniref:EF-hand domain-containing protein n=1 Tax=Sphingomonas sp. TaxID=28214 RepID=UPI003F7D2D94
MTPPSDTNAAPAQPQAKAPATPTPANPAPQTTPAPTTAVPGAPPATASNQPQATPAPTTPAPDTQAANPAPAAPAAAAATPANTPANAGSQVAAVVNSEYGSYDKNGDGKLDKTEFGAWMTALRSKADPSLKDDAANKAWIAQAFTQADSDKSKSISKDELTNFLSQGSGQKAS